MSLRAPLSCDRSGCPPGTLAVLAGGQGQALLNFSKAMIGSGLLVAPHIVAEMGVFVGPVLLLAALVTAGYGMNLVLLSSERYVASSRAPRPATVAELTGVLLGSRWQRLVEVLTIVMQCCFSIAFVYVILGVADRLSGGMGWVRIATALCLVCLSVTLGVAQGLRDLWCVSAVGLSVFIFGVIGGSIYQGTCEDRAFYTRGESLATASALDWTRWFGTFLYNVEAVNHVIPNATSLDEPHKMSSILVMTFAAYFFLIGTWEVYAAAVGYGDCQGKNDTILECLTPGPVSDVVNIAVALNVAMSMPISLFPAVQMLEGMFGFATPSAPSFASGAELVLRVAAHDGDINDVADFPPPSIPVVQGASRLVLRIALFAGVVAAGTLVSRLDVFTGLVGSTVMTVLGFVVPVRLYAAASALPPAEPPRRRLALNVFHALLAGAGVALAVVETVGKLSS